MGNGGLVTDSLEVINMLTCIGFLPTKLKTIRLNFCFARKVFKVLHCLSVLKWYPETYTHKLSLTLFLLPMSPTISVLIIASHVSSYAVR